MSQGTLDREFMGTAMAIAAGGRGGVEPNPMVGAVIVRGGVEIARGGHRRFGGPHAEIEALAAARAAGADVRGATMYVALEPCCHQGKTPPCTNALIEAGIVRVVAAMQDVDSRVAGRGFAQLRQAGIEVVCGVCEPQARKLLRAYIKLRTRGRPWVIGKWAQTADGCLLFPPGDPRRWISSEAGRSMVHEIRSYCDGILAGIGTVLHDDPRLNNRSGYGKQPSRVILDASLRTPPVAKLFATAGGPVLIACADGAEAASPARAAALKAAGAELLPLPSGEGRLDLNAMLDHLGARQWTYLLVEGGAAAHRSFLSQGLVDELLVFLSPDRCGPGQGLPRLDFEAIRGGLPIEEMEEYPMERDRVCHAVLKWAE